MWSAAAGMMSSLTSSLMPSASVCSQPNLPPTRVGPRRSWMRPATLRSSQTEKIAETSIKPIRAPAAMMASRTNHKPKELASANRGEATSPGSFGHTPDWSAVRTGVTLWGNAAGGNRVGIRDQGSGVRGQKTEVRGEPAMNRILDRRALASLPRRQPRQLPRDWRLPLIYRLNLNTAAERVSTDPLARDANLAALEAALLVADEPVPTRRLAQAAGLADATTARRLLKKLQSIYDQDGTAFQIEEIAGGFQLLTRPQYHRWLASLRRCGHDLRLSGPAREILAIVAYRQPIMRAAIENIRGVNCSETLRLLMERGLIKIAGRDDSLGRPVLYGTTKKFLQVFGLKSIKDLPRKSKSGSSNPDATNPDTF